MRVLQACFDRCVRHAHRVRWLGLDRARDQPRRQLHPAECQRAVAIAIAAALTPLTARAQDAPAPPDTLPVSVGARVRVNEQRVGYVVAQRSGTVEIARCPSCSPHAIPRASVVRLETSGGRRRSILGTITGAVGGAAVGTAIGFAVAARSCPTGGCGPSGAGAALAIPAFAGAGSVVGAIAGSYWRMEYWEPVALGR